MKQITYICDCCNKKIEDAEWYTIFCGITNGTNTVTKTQELFADVCPDCMEKLKVRLQSPEEPETQKEEPAKKPKPVKKTAPTKKPFDQGKAKALRDAGWSYEKIADEMKVAVGTVYKYLNQEVPA